MNLGFGWEHAEQWFAHTIRIVCINRIDDDFDCVACHFDGEPALSIGLDGHIIQSTGSHWKVRDPETGVRWTAKNNEWSVLH